MSEIPIALAVLWTVIKTSSYAFWELKKKKIWAGVTASVLSLSVIVLYLNFCKGYF